jgi:hypothetical protein
MAADPDTTPPQKGDMPVILQRLLDRELIEWPEVARGARPGWLLPEFGEE